MEQLKERKSSNKRVLESISYLHIHNILINLQVKWKLEKV